MNKNRNPNCDKDQCTSPTGEVRLLPTGGGGNMIVCHACYQDEIAYRGRINRINAGASRYETPSWEELETYQTA